MDYISAIVIRAPQHVQAVAVPLRQYSLDSVLRIPAHITVLTPFAPLDDLDAACRKLRAIFADVPPFEVTLDGYGHFPTVVYMQPADPDPIKALYRRIHAHFPDYLPYHGTFGSDEITPHLTVGGFTSEVEREQVTFPPYEPLTFTVHQLDLIVFDENDPTSWITHDLIPLGGKRA